MSARLPTNAARASDGAAFSHLTLFGSILLCAAQLSQNIFITGMSGPTSVFPARSPGDRFAMSFCTISWPLRAQSATTLMTLTGKPWSATTSAFAKPPCARTIEPPIIPGGTSLALW